MISEQKVTAFISHRCDEYHGSLNELRKAFEFYLQNYSIDPKYGCRPLEDDRSCNLPGRMKKAMSESQIFIAFISDSWGNSSNLKWPEKEWKIWNETWKQNEAVSLNVIGYCLGNKICQHRNIGEIHQFLIDIDRSSGSPSIVARDKAVINDMSQTIRDAVDRARNYLNRGKEQIGINP